MLIPSQWTPTSLSWLHSGSPCIDLGTQFKTLVSPDMQFTLSRKMGPDPTPKLSDARRNRTPTHWFNIKQVTLLVEQVIMYMEYLVGLVQKRFIIYIPTVLSRNWRAFCKEFRLRWSAVSMNLARIKVHKMYTDVSDNLPPLQSCNVIKYITEQHSQHCHIKSLN